MSWFELPEDDQPPEEIWLDDEELAGHFETVRMRYRMESGAGGVEPIDDPGDLESNELTAALKRG